MFSSKPRQAVSVNPSHMRAAQSTYAAIGRFPAFRPTRLPIERYHGRRGWSFCDRFFLPGHGNEVGTLTGTHSLRRGLKAPLKFHNQFGVIPAIADGELVPNNAAAANNCTDYRWIVETIDRFDPTRVDDLEGICS